MEIKAGIKKFTIIFAIIFVGYLLQTAVFPYIALANVVPNFLVIVTASFGLIRGSKYGMGVGMVCGLITDFYSGSYLGCYMLLFLFIGYLSGLFKRLFYGDDIKLPLAIIGTCDMIYGIIIYFVNFLFRQQFSFPYYFFNVIIPEAVYTVLVAIIVYYVILRINQWIDKADKRSGRDFV